MIESPTYDPVKSLRIVLDKYADLERDYYDQGKKLLQLQHEYDVLKQCYLDMKNLADQSNKLLQELSNKQSLKGI